MRRREDLDKLHNAALQSISFRQRVTRRHNTTSYASTSHQQIQPPPPSSSSSTTSLSTTSTSPVKDSGSTTTTTTTTTATTKSQGLSRRLFNYNSGEKKQQRSDVQDVNARINNATKRNYRQPSLNIRVDCGEPPSSRFVLRPDHRFRSAWDFFILVLLCYVVTVSIFVYSFHGNIFLGKSTSGGADSPPHNSAWFWIERFLDFAFFIDILFNFITAYEKDGTFVTHLPSIRRRYFYTWFFPDLVSVLPWDIFAETVNNATSDPEIQVHYLQLPRLFRLIRLLRFIRLMRILRMKESFRKFEVKFRLKGGHLRLATLIITVLLLAHWFACLFFFFGNLNQKWDSDVYLPWLLTDKTDDIGDDGDPSNRARTAYGSGTYDQYLAALYFSVYTITTIGYGDVVPRTTIDRTYTTIIMLLGAACFAYVISQVSDICSELNAVKIHHRIKMDSLIDMAKSRNLPDWLVCDIKRFYDRENLRQRIKDESELLQAMSRDLRVKVLKRMYGTHLEESELLRGIPPSHLATIYEHLSEKIFREGDTLFRVGDRANQFFIIIKGDVRIIPEVDENDGYEDEDEVEVPTKTNGDIVGEESVLFHRRRKAKAECMSDTDVVVVPRSAIMEVMNAHQEILVRRKQRQARELWDRTILLVEKQIRFAKMASDLKVKAILHSRERGMETVGVRGEEEAEDEDRVATGMSVRRAESGDGLEEELGLDNDDNSGRVQDLENKLHSLQEQLEVIVTSLKQGNVISG